MFCNRLVISHFYNLQKKEMAGIINSMKLDIIMYIGLLYILKHQT